LEKVKTAICEIVDLYAKRYEDVFTMLPKFVEIIWSLLTSVGLESKNDHVGSFESGRLVLPKDLRSAPKLVSIAITFLSSVAKLPRHKALFANEGTLQGITEKVILPNMRLRGRQANRLAEAASGTDLRL
jgi:exportin-2 (importin alpha re-exporter)